MKNNSRQVLSSQTAPHEALERTLLKHLDSSWKKPVAEHTRSSFESASRWRDQRGEAPLILDSGCGSGRSSRALAISSPESLVIGIDQSDERLSRYIGPLPNNLLLLRAEAADFWRLLVEEGWCLEAHYLLYPNPWPKPSQLKRRWHGHPVFPTLLSLGGGLELRTNWRVYAEEFAQALTICGVQSRLLPLAWSAAPLSDFELKYQASGHLLFQITADLAGTDACFSCTAD